MRSFGGQRLTSWDQSLDYTHDPHGDPRRNDCSDDRREQQEHHGLCDPFTSRRRDWHYATQLAPPRLAELRGDRHAWSDRLPGPRRHDQQPELSGVRLPNNTDAFQPSPRHRESSAEAFHHHENSSRVVQAVSEHGLPVLIRPRLFSTRHAESYRSDNQLTHEDSPWRSPSSRSSGHAIDDFNGFGFSTGDISFGINRPANLLGIHSPQHHESKAQAASLASTSSPLVKQSRYLREMDRRLILSRLAKGEKQAALAKEYNVSRSTICNLLKQRDVVLARKHENPLCRHPKKTRAATTAPTPLATTGAQETETLVDSIRREQGDHEQEDLSEPPAQSSAVNLPSNSVVIQVQSRAIALLQTKLHDRKTSDDDFRWSSVRLMRLLLEEAIGSVAAVSRSSLNDHRVVNSMCAIAMGESGSALLDVFRRLEPEVSTGFLAGSLVDPFERELYMLSHPRDLRGHHVLLLETVLCSGDEACAATDLLRAKGIVDEQITMVALFVAADVVALVQHQCPRVRILTTGVDTVNSATKPSASRVFLERFLLSYR